MAKTMTFICEGCGAKAVDKIGPDGPRHPLLPDGWAGFGMSARRPDALAHWCATCHANGTMKTHAATTHRRAVAVARRRGLLETLRP